MSDGGLPSLRDALSAVGDVLLLLGEASPPEGWRRLTLSDGLQVAVPREAGNRALVAARELVTWLAGADDRVEALQRANRMLAEQVDALLRGFATGEAEESEIPTLFGFLPSTANLAVLRGGVSVLNRGIDQHSVRIETRRMQQRTEHSCKISTGRRFVYRSDPYVAVVDTEDELDPVQRQLVRLCLAQLARRRVQGEQYQLIRRVRDLMGIQRDLDGGDGTGVAESPETTAATSMEQRVTRLVETTVRDSLTQLYNRVKVTTVIEALLARCEPFSIVLADIDHFKSVNDTYGHLAGDRVIVEVASCLTAEGREDDVIARWGGEEFVAILPGARRAEATSAAQRWRTAIARGIRCEDRIITCSFGVAEHRSGEREKELFHRADLALYRAKHGGRDRVEAD